LERRADVLRKIIAVIVGLAVGAGVNMSLVILGPSVVPPPPGVDVTDAESLSASMHLFEAKHFVVPFLAHALGTLVGALIAFLVAGNRPVYAYVVGAAFLAGGISASFVIPAPTWFIFLDLVVAYIPMAWMGTVIGRRIKGAVVPASS
jgi:hypothetical protein